MLLGITASSDFSQNNTYLHCLAILWCFPQLDYEKKKKEEGKRARADRQQVLDMLFSAFEKHQYYNIKDLVDITKQPVVSFSEL